MTLLTFRTLPFFPTRQLSLSLFSSHSNLPSNFIVLHLELCNCLRFSVSALAIHVKVSFVHVESERIWGACSFEQIVKRLFIEIVYLALNH